jgi:hypothetical protein
MSGCLWTTLIPSLLNTSSKEAPGAGGTAGAAGEVDTSAAKLNEK